MQDYTVVRQMSKSLIPEEFRKVFKGEATKADKIGMIIAQLGFCNDKQRKQVCDIFSVLLDEDVKLTGKYAGDVSKLVPGGVYVPIVCTNSHDYPIGEPCLILTGPAGGVRINGSLGNTLEVRDVRWASEEEVDKFYDALTKLPKAPAIGFSVPVEK